MAKPKRRKKLIVFSVLGLLLVAGLVTAKLRQHDPPIPISEDKVVRRNITEVVPGNGKVEPIVLVNIAPEVSGEITDMAVKEGQHVNKGDLLFKIKPDNYVAARNQAEAGYKSAIAGRDTSAANLEKADLENKRNLALFKAQLISESDYLTAKTAYDVAKTTLAGSVEQVSIAKAELDNADADLSKTTVYSPLTGTVSKLNCQVGERVVGVAQMAGTEVMTVADLTTMEARVDIGEIDVPLIKISQKATLEVDAFQDKKFEGLVTEVADSANNNDTSATASASTSTDATKFQVKIRLLQTNAFLPGMSVTADIETRYRTNVLSVPIQSVTTRLPPTNSAPSNSLALLAGKTNADTNVCTTDCDTNTAVAASTNSTSPSKPGEPPKPIDVVFVVDGDHVKMVPVKIGISDDNYVEILDGLKAGQEVVSGGYKAINRDLEDGKHVVINTLIAGQDKAAVKTY
ncbi:MAG TPA: efflux RND transporter periplasmic adaptor subunit [Verrucomicrobiae bacterium]|jgi:HlyD family secretion protein|nr:efflux RND transporter periplasmic adaptor subunit [Verrucomicrobiae bacterium]